ncbi:MAG: hypothetical protein V3T69_04350, partial [Acidiferrobacterales bacterium]
IERGAFIRLAAAWREMQKRRLQGETCKRRFSLGADLQVCALPIDDSGSPCAANANVSAERAERL